MSLPRPQNVRFQVSMRGIRFRNLKEARADFFNWLMTGESVSKIKVHIWQNEKERIVEKIGDDPKGEILRQTLRGALQSGKLRIRENR